MKKLSLCLCASVVSFLSAQAGPRIQFETNFFDFGHLVAVESVTGSFKVKNVGDVVLKLDPPHPSCGCTDAKAPETLGPGESGEITYRINLDHPMQVNQKAITMVSNDPEHPSTTLKIQLEYDPVYEIGGKKVVITVPVGSEQASESLTINRADEKPLEIDKAVASPDWIDGVIEAKPDDSSGQIVITVKRSPKVPAHFDGTVKLYNSRFNKDVPVRTIAVIGNIDGELAASPRGLYWMFSDQGSDLTKYPASALSRSVQLKSVLGHEVQIKSAKCSIKGTSVQVVSKEPGKTFDLVLKLDEVPHAFVNGKVTLETSLESLPTMEVPVTINVFKQ